MTKTTQIAADRAYDEAKTVLPAEVARGVYMRNAPSLAALKLMHLLIGKAGGRMAEPIRHEIRLSDIRKIDGMKNHDRASLTPLFAELSAAVLTHDDPEKMVVTIGGLLDFARIDYRHEVSNDLLVSWYFGGAFREMAEKSCHWAILDRQTVFALSSKYSILLFQHIASLVNLDHVASKTFTVAELRAVLGVPHGKMERWNDVNRFALTPAIAEINQTSRLILTATPNKIGRTVASVTITWAEKPPEGKQEAKRELDRPKVGREARRNGSAETVARAFPSSGSIEFDDHWKALKRAAGCNMDNTMIAEKFRAWCASKGLSLDGRNIEQAFSNFCATVGKV
ncbi:MULTISPECIES: replication initiation protein [Paracoccaceae]|uniref:Replication protein n=1 Tax=Fuscovulum blasticum TaxID=1075 RepID=Q8GI69_FUSBL|nr:replication initiation protein [Fuscovulum blasticum]BAC54125.1 replication protein [Fuscovulum blasticum]CAQ58479.1 RepA protein [Expression vector pIND4]